jgi:catechol 2,3-dioxygenase-like lactoylglutathione lyase family enzyme
LAVTFERAAAVIPVLDLDAALDRYRRLGFTVSSYEGGPRYGFADREGVSFHITEWDEHDPKRTASQVYIYVGDADAVHAEWARAGVDGRLTDPADTEYGLREFAYVDPDGTLLRVGSQLQTSAASTSP